MSHHEVAALLFRRHAPRAHRLFRRETLPASLDRIGLGVQQEALDMSVVPLQFNLRGRPQGLVHRTKH